VHLVGFIIRIYHDARSSECQIRVLLHDKAWEFEDTVVLDFRFYYSILS
jgi:hypothetical protein